jgi:hypothetical protein
MKGLEINKGIHNKEDHYKQILLVWRMDFRIIVKPYAILYFFKEMEKKGQWIKVHISITVSKYVTVPTALISRNKSKNEVYCNTRIDRLCDLVVSVPGYKSRSAGSIPGATTFF